MAQQQYQDAETINPEFLAQMASLSAENESIMPSSVVTPDTNTLSFKIVSMLPNRSNESEWNAPDTTRIKEAKDSLIEDLNGLEKNNPRKIVYKVENLHLIWNGLTLSNENYTLKQYHIKNGSIILGIYISPTVNSMFPVKDITFDLRRFRMNVDNSNNNNNTSTNNNGNKNSSIISLKNGGGGDTLLPKHVTCLCGAHMVATTPRVCSINDCDSQLTYEQVMRNQMMMMTTPASPASPTSPTSPASSTTAATPLLGNNSQSAGIGSNRRTKRSKNRNVNHTPKAANNNNNNNNNNSNNISRIVTQTKKNEKFEENRKQNGVRCWMYRCQQPNLSPDSIVFYCKNHTKSGLRNGDTSGNGGGGGGGTETATPDSDEKQEAASSRNDDTKEEKQQQQEAQSANTQENREKVKEKEKEELLGVGICLECSKIVFALDWLDLSRKENLRFVNMHINVLINRFLIHTKLNSLMMSFLNHMKPNSETLSNAIQNTTVSSPVTAAGLQKENATLVDCNNKSAKVLKSRAKLIKKEFYQLLSLLVNFYHNGTKLFLIYIETICENIWLKKIVQTIMKNKLLFDYFVFRMSHMFNIKINLQIITQLMLNRTFVLLSKEAIDSDETLKNVNRCQSLMKANDYNSEQCNTFFNWYIKRHHCRVCGKSVCSNHIGLFGVSLLEVADNNGGNNNNNQVKTTTTKTKTPKQKLNDIFSVDICQECQVYDYWFYTNTAKEQWLQSMIKQIKDAIAKKFNRKKSNNNNDNRPTVATEKDNNNNNNNKNNGSNDEKKNENENETENDRNGIEDDNDNKVETNENNENNENKNDNENDSVGEAPAATEANQDEQDAQDAQDDDNDNGNNNDNDDNDDNDNDKDNENENEESDNGLVYNALLDDADITGFDALQFINNDY